MLRLAVVLSVVGLGCSFESGGNAPSDGATVGGTETSSGTASTDPSGPTGPTDPSAPTDPSDPSAPTDPSGPTDPSDPSTSDGSTTEDSSTTSEGTSSSTGGQTEDSSSTGEPPFVLCDDSLAELRACYDFAGADLGTLTDGSMHANDGATAGVVLETGPFGDAARFSATTEVSVPDSETLDVPVDLTYEVWVRLDSVPVAGRVGILDKEGQYSLTLYAEQGLRCSAAGANLFAAPIIVDQWFHVACVHDGANLSIWVDGELVDTGASNGTVMVGNTLPMSLGDTSPAFTEPMDGVLGGVRIWNVARTPEEIQEAAAVIR